MEKKIKVTKDHEFKITHPDFDKVKQYCRYFYEEDDYYNYQLDDGLWVFMSKIVNTEGQYYVEIAMVETEDLYLGLEDPVFKSKDGLFTSQLLARSTNVTYDDLDSYHRYRLKNKLNDFIDGEE